MKDEKELPLHTKAFEWRKQYLAMLRRNSVYGDYEIEANDIDAGYEAGYKQAIEDIARNIKR